MKENCSPEELLARAYALDNQADTKQLYRDWAKTYDETMIDGLGYLTPAKTSKLLGEFLPDKNAAILDVGSGTGLAGLELSKLGYTNLTALDYSNAMLEIAKSRSIYRDFIVADLNAPLAIASDSFDAMICTGTFTHAHVGAQCLDELLRIMKPGGIMACTVQKDVWLENGFDKKINELIGAGAMHQRHQALGTYFMTDEEPEGYYCLWQKTSELTEENT